MIRLFFVGYIKTLAIFLWQSENKKETIRSLVKNLEAAALFQKLKNRLNFDLKPKKAGLRFEENFYLSDVLQKKTSTKINLKLVSDCFAYFLHDF